MMTKCIFKRTSLWYLVTITQQTLKNTSIPCRRRNRAPCRFGLLWGDDLPEQLQGFHHSSLFLHIEKVQKILRSQHPSSLPPPCNSWWSITPKRVHGHHSKLIPYMLASVQEHFRASVQSWVQRSKPCLSTALHETKWPPQMSLN